MHPTKIEWTDFAWNPIRARNRETGEVGHYCQKISPACTHCYAAAFNVQQRHRRKDGQPGKSGTGLDFVPASLPRLELFVDREELLSPLRRKKPTRIFVCDMTDLFLSEHSVAWLDMVLAVMALCPQHTFQVLTKRPRRMSEYMALLKTAAEDWQRKVGSNFTETDVLNFRWLSAWNPALAPGGAIPHNSWPLPNVHFGVTVEDQVRAEERLPLLAATPAAARFVSYEPALEQVDFERINAGNGYRLDALRGNLHGLITRDIKPTGRIDQIICGGESGPKSRPSDPAIFRRTRDACDRANVAFFFKQHGDWCAFEDIPEEWLRTHDIEAFPSQMIGERSVHRIGKSNAEAMLDGQEWRETPALAQLRRG
mgnify:CR=1 FL=1